MLHCLLQLFADWPKWIPFYEKLYIHSKVLPGRTLTTFRCSAVTVISGRDEQEDVVTNVVSVPSIPSKKTEYSTLCYHRCIMSTQTNNARQQLLSSTRGGDEWRHETCSTRRCNSCKPGRAWQTVANVERHSEKVGLFLVIYGFTRLHRRSGISSLLPV